MPIDSSIPGQALGGLQRAQPFNPMATLGDLAQLQNYRAQMELRQQQAQREQYEFQKQQQIDALAQQHGNDPDAFVSAVGRVDPFLASKYAEQLSKARVEGAKAKGEEVKQSLAYIEAGTQLLQGATPESYGARREMILKSAPDLAQILPDQYDETAINGVLQMGQSTKDFLAAQAKGIEQFVNGKPQEALGTMFANAQTPQQWQMVQDMAAKAGQKALLPYFGDFSPENVAKARSLALGPAKEADLADKAIDNAREERRFAHTVANDAAQIALSRGNLGVAQANLGIRKAELAHRIAEDAKPKAADAKSGKPDVGAIMGQIEMLSNRINTKDDGPLTTVTGWARSKMAGLNLDNDVNEYQSLIEGMIPMVARAVGHTGVLTQQDVDSVRRLFPAVGDNSTLAKNKMARVKQLLKSTGEVTPPSATAAAPAATTKADPLGIR